MLAVFSIRNARSLLPALVTLLASDPAWAQAVPPAAQPGSPEPSDDSKVTPYDPWDGQYYPPPGAPPPGMAPPPAVSRPTRSRRAVELIPQLGAAVPACLSGERSDDRCNGLGVGGHLGFLALWRVHPHAAWGGELDVAGFRYDPAPRLERNRPEAGALFFGVVGRAYALEDGWIDPYFQLGLGIGVSLRAFHDPEGDRIEESGAGPAVQLGAGVDFHLSRRLRLGPAVTYTQVFVDKIRVCNTDAARDDCIDLDKNEDGFVTGYGTFGARLTIMLGRAL